MTFYVSGMIWRGNLIMGDTETSSEWSQIYGQAMNGPLKGQYLSRCPSQVTDWQTWREFHPDSSVALFSRTVDDYRTRIYGAPGLFVFSIEDKEDSLGWSFPFLDANPVHNDEFITEPILVLFDVSSSTCRLYSRRVGSQVVRFHDTGDGLRDEETDSLWNKSNMAATSGKLAGNRLNRLNGTVSFRSVWLDYFPRGRMIDLSE